MALMVRELSAVVTAHVGDAITLVPTKVAQLVVLVGVIVEGKVILMMPAEDRASCKVILI